MRKFNIWASLFMGLALFTACEDQDNTPTLQEPATFTLNVPAYVNTTYDLENSPTLELTCSPPNYGFTAATSYAVEVSLSGEWGEGKSALLGTVSESAKINVDAAELAATLTALSGLDASAFPFTTSVDIRLKATLTTSGKGEVYSNVITLPNVRLHYALPPVLMPESMYINGSMCSADWNWNSSFEMIPTYDNDGTFWRLVYIPAGGEMKFNKEKAWDGGEFGASATLNDNANAGLSGDGNIVIANGGWYLIVVHTAIEGRNYIYTVDFNEPNVYLMGSNAPVNDWSINEANLFSVPSDAEGNFVSPAFAYDTDGDGGIRACVSIEGYDWWKTEFMVFGNELKYRATGGDQERVNGTKGQVLSINFTNGTGSIN